jgi:ABC-type antimicrobial peptide transport system permease subunit
MRILDIIGMSFKSLWRRKVRTLLTVLGVVIGSCAIVVMISLGLGMDNAMKYYLTQFGDLNVITVYGNVWTEGQTEPMKITEENVEYIKTIENVEGIFPKLAITSHLRYTRKLNLQTPRTTTSLLKNRFLDLNCSVNRDNIKLNV